MPEIFRFARIFIHIRQKKRIVAFQSPREKTDFAAAMERGRVKGRISVRRAQMKMLDGGNGTMGVWFGKQILGQRDLVTTEHTGRGGGPIKVTGKPDFTRLTEPEILG